jgi:hypothetical protein
MLRVVCRAGVGFVNGIVSFMFAKWKLKTEVTRYKKETLTCVLYVRKTETIREKVMG